MNGNDKSSSSAPPGGGEEEKKAASPQDAFAAAVSQAAANKTNNGDDDDGFLSRYRQQQNLPPQDADWEALPGASLVLNPLQRASPPSTPEATTTNASTSSKPAIPKAAHNRTVSFGIAPPSAFMTTSPMTAAAVAALPSYDGPSSSSSSTGGIKKEIDLNTVLSTGPSELEAETYILQAVEKVAAAQAHQRTNTETDRLFAAIAQEEIQKQSQQQTTTVEEEDEEEEEEKEKASTQQTEAAAARPQLQATKSSRFQGLVKKQMKASTVEGNLFSLTSALAELDTAAASGNSKHHSRKDSQAIGTNFSAADKLSLAANQMIHGKSKHTIVEKEEEDELQSTDDDVESRGNQTLSMLEHEITVFPDAGAAGGGGDHMNNNNNAGGDHYDKKKKRKKHRSAGRVVKDGVKEEWELFHSFLGQRKASMQAYAKKIIMSLFLPSLAIAIFLFYVVEDPEKCVAALANNHTSNAARVLQVSASGEALYFRNDTINNSPVTAVGSILQDDDAIYFSNDTTAPGTTTTASVPNVGSTTGDNTTRPPLQESESRPMGNWFTCEGLGASASWWFLFLGVRQVITFTMALITQSLVIDYLALGSRLSLDCFGPIVTLLVVGSKGWPFVLFFWAVYDLILLSGDRDYAHQWGYWQDWVDLFNDTNPSGNVVNNEWNYKILQNAMFVGACVAIKRLVVGLMLGRQTFVHYGEELAKVLKNMVLVGEIATLGKEIEKYVESFSFRDDYKFSSDVSVFSNNSGPGVGFTKNIQDMVVQAEEEANVKEEQIASGADAAKAYIARRNAPPQVPPSPGSPLPQPPQDDASDSDDSGVVEADPEFTQSEQIKMMELLEAWEEPTTAEEKEEKKVTLAAVLQFRQSLTYMKKQYPFTPAFGPADTRDKCIASSQQVYDRLLMRTPHRSELPFETLALLAKDEKGGINQEKAKELIRAFRPDRDGKLGKLEFVKSIDAIYKELRLLAANINNSSQMDAAVENLVNVVFYIVLGAMVINRVGENPLTLFFSFSSIILAFAFMFGKSAAKYFDGCLFILVQRPYGVGDRIHLSNPMLETNPEGSSGWIVEKVTLFTTSVYWGATNERATLCNGAISNSRVINAARSPNAVVFVLLKFGIDTPYEKIEIFKAAVEQFLKDRPREWLAFSGFRPTEVAVDKGYIAYKVIAQHRNGWQQTGNVFESKANLATYCLEITKQLDMRYMSPHLPVDLNIKGNDMPMFPGETEQYEMSGGDGPMDASPKSASDALAAISTGLRQRKAATSTGQGKTDFAALVRLAMAANRHKNKGE